MVIIYNRIAQFNYIERVLCLNLIFMSKTLILKANVGQLGGLARVGLEPKFVAHL